MRLEECLREIISQHNPTNILWRECNNEPSPLWYGINGLYSLIPLYKRLNIDVYTDDKCNIYESQSKSMLFKRCL